MADGWACAPDFARNPRRSCRPGADSSCPPARHTAWPNRVHFRLGLVFRLGLLSTCPRGHAVALGYLEVARCFKTQTFTGLFHKRISARTAAACCRFPGASPLARHHSRPSPYPPPGSAEPQFGVLRTRTSSNTLRTRPCLPTSPLPTSPSPFKQPKALDSCEHHSSLCVRSTPTRPLPQGRGRAPARPPLRSSPRSRPSRPCLRTSTPLFPAPPSGFNTGPPSYWPRLLFQTQPRTSAFQDADSSLSDASIPFPPP